MPRDETPLDSRTASVGQDVVDELRRARAGGRPASVVLYHRDGTSLLSLVDRRPIVIGREAPSDLVLQDRSLSRQHLRLELIDGAVWVEDLGSTNGTRVNGEVITRTRLKAGDEVCVGAVLASLHQIAGREAGLASHDELMDGVALEAARSRQFRRPFVLALMRPAPGGESHFTQWAPKVSAALRPVDRVGAYGPDWIEVLLPESGAVELQALAERLNAGARAQPLQIGGAVFPAAAASPAALLDAALDALRQTSAERRLFILGTETSSTFERPLLPPSFESEAMRAIKATVERVANALVPVLIQGETGTGKEVIARLVHERSERRKAPLIAVNCAAMPGQLLESTLFGHEKGAFTGAVAQAQGVFEAADGGTVFLDEVGELSAPAQAALLRVLETKRLTRVGSNQELEVDVRVLAATHRDLERMCEEGTFRWDLLFRLNTISLALPPLREREDEIPALARHFLERANKENRREVRHIAPAALEALGRYGWPGNVRELKNAIDRAVVIARDDELLLEDLPDKVRRVTSTQATPSAPRSTGAQPDLWDLSLPLSLKQRQQKLECGLILRALEQAEGNQTEAARLLGMPLRTLVHRLKTYGIKKLGYGFSAERDDLGDES